MTLHLTSEDKLVLDCYLRGYKTDEIAKMMGRHKKTISNRMARARQRNHLLGAQPGALVKAYLRQQRGMQ